MNSNPKATDLATSLESLSSEITRLDAEVAKIDADGSKGFRDDVDRLKRLRDEVAQGIDEISGEHAGDDLVRAFDALDAELRKSVGKIG